MVNSNEHNAHNATLAEVPAWINGYLTADEIKKIESLIAGAERRTSGEIVPVIVRESVKKEPPTLVFSSLLVFIFFIYAESRLASWLELSDIIFIGCGVAISAILGRLLSRLGPVRRVFARDRDLTRYAELRAELEFYRAGIGSTSGKTGILLFLSVQDRRAVVLADQAISEKLPQDTWDHVLRLLVGGIKNGKCFDGLKSAIQECGGILATHFPIAANDVNELTNRLIVRD